jgi:molybdopterin molybdotransferase
MISIEDALAAYSRFLDPLPSETVATLDALDRVLAEAVDSHTDLPRFDQSAMDGYALNSADVAEASAAAPIRLSISQKIAAGTHRTLTPLLSGCAARILTGAPVPPGADTVVPQERIERDGHTLVFSAPYPARANIRWRGEELSRGTRVAAVGHRIDPGTLALLVNAGAPSVTVYRRPRVRLLVTGDEIRPAGTRLEPGQIPDSNGPLVRAVLRRWGFEPPTVEYVADTADAVRDALANALDEADLVLSSGGASVGDHDFLPVVAEQLGVDRVFWKVAQKPGKPLYFGIRNGARRCALLAMPGNPGAVLISLCLHVRSAIDCLEGLRAPGPLWHQARADERVERDDRRARLMRMRLVSDAGGTTRLIPLPHQDSHMLSNLSAADVLAWIPAGIAPVEREDTLLWTPLPR